MNDMGAQIVAGVLNGILAATYPGECTPAGRCWLWSSPPPRVIVVPQAPPIPQYIPQTRIVPPPPAKDPQEARLRDSILQFCASERGRNEQFCSDLDVWFQHHPEAHR
jgi:hypothetical protein